MGTQGGPAKRQDLIFAVEDPRHQMVRLERSTWHEYISVHHPEIARVAESALRKLISAPLRITSTADKNVAAFEDDVLMAVVLFEDDDASAGNALGRVATVYPASARPPSGYYKAPLNYRAPLYCRAPVLNWRGKVRRRPGHDSMTLDYDEPADVLYITFATRESEARYLETARGQILRLNKRSGKVLSCTIPMFSVRASSGELLIPEVGVALPAAQLGALLKH